ncbi:MAG: ATP-binding cassette domain-containing protein [Deferribacteres bacterium]|nr:ATP-binding cassette domain-containing protein [candidate division KSB1 bacterium]MCB9500783.1 ATP-binding cassette domain-containing protein [Deferribacteres bacterium]
MIFFDQVTAGYIAPDGSPLPILKDLSLKIEKGEFVTIMGANGSGKTTLMRLCNGLITPQSGIISIDEHKISANDHSEIMAVRRRVGMVFQNPENQIVSTTVEREIAFGLENLGIPHEEMVARVENSLQQFDLQKYRHRSPAMLSGGEKQRLAVASVLVMDPAYLIFDEPTSLLDVQHRRALLQLMQSLHQDSSHVHTLINVTQFPQEALISTRLIVLHEGRIVLDAPPKEAFLQVDLLQKFGIVPPIEFLVFKELTERYDQVTSLDDLLLPPII